jgi:hypothetical protein
MRTRDWPSGVAIVIPRVACDVQGVVGSLGNRWCGSYLGSEAREREGWVCGVGCVRTVV